MINDPNFYDFVFKQRDNLSEDITEDDKLLTNILLLVSTGAFGLSITFYLNKNLPIDNPNILITSWIFLALSIIFNASGYYLSRKTKQIRYNFLNEKIASRADFTVKDYNESLDNFEKSLTEKIVDWFNFITFITFNIGIISLVIFAILQV